MSKKYEKKKISVEESLFDEVNLKPLSEFLSKLGIDALIHALNESIFSSKIEGDSND